MTIEKSQSQRLHIIWFHLLSSKWLDYGGGDERDRDREIERERDTEIKRVMRDKTLVFQKRII